LRPSGHIRLFGTGRAAAWAEGFATVVDVTLSELKLEAFLPADAESTDVLQMHHNS
jgi:hypothetical protein